MGEVERYMGWVHRVLPQENCASITHLHAHSSHSLPRPRKNAQMDHRYACRPAQYQKLQQTHERPRAEDGIPDGDRVRAENAMAGSSCSNKYRADRPSEGRDRRSFQVAFARQVLKACFFSPDKSRYTLLID